MAADDLLARIAEEPSRAALFLDVDGVLAPIVETPSEARVPDETRQELRRLSSRYALVACVTGRPTEDAREIVGVEELVYVGEHGLELAPEAAEWASTFDRFATSFALPVERKRFSLSYHYRTAPDESAAVAVLQEVAARAEAEGLVPRWGRKVLELRPPVDANKGTAVRALLAERGLRRALYAGDDTTDLDAFAALANLDVGLRVAVASAEAPEELRGAADLIVEGPGELLDLLRRL